MTLLSSAGRPVPANTTVSAAPGSQLTFFVGPPPAITPEAPEMFVPLAQPQVRLSKKGSLVTSSQDVAQAFGKKHQHVLRDIRTLQASLAGIGEDRLLFHDHTYEDANGQRRPEIVMVEDGFMLLVMGYSGDTALRVKLAYIAEFNRMRAKLSKPAPAPNASDVARLESYTDPVQQRYCARSVAAELMGMGGRTAIIKHHREVMQVLVQQRPSAWKRQLVQQGYKVKSLSGRDLLRRFAPHKAAAAAVIDDAVRSGRTLEQVQQTGLPQLLTGTFNSLLALNLRLADLPE